MSKLDPPGNKITCKNCGVTVQSQYPGHFSECSCDPNSIFIDTSYNPNTGHIYYERVGGDLSQMILGGHPLTEYPPLHPEDE